MPLLTPMPDEETSGGTEPVGQQLRALREARGLTVEQAVAATNIRAETIEAIEADTIAGTKSPTYVRGFVRIYCEYLEADTDEIMGAFDQLCLPEQARLYVPGVGSMSRTDYRPGRRGHRRGERHAGMRLLVKALLVLVLAAAAAYVYVYFDELFGITEKLPATETSEGPDTGAEATETPVTMAEGRFALGVMAKANVWIKIKVDGQVSYDQVLLKGKFKSRAGNESVSIELPDASQVQVYWGKGELIPKPPEDGPATVTLTEDGLEVTTNNNE